MAHNKQESLMQTERVRVVGQRQSILYLFEEDRHDKVLKYYKLEFLTNLKYLDIN